MQKVALGSTNRFKMDAVKEGFLKAGLEVEVIGCEVDSGQNAQPVGFSEMLAGARERAFGAQRFYPDCITVGIESGLLRASSVTIDLAVIVVIARTRTLFVSTSPGIQLLETFVDVAAEQGFGTTTAGAVIAEKLGGAPGDPHSILTQGRVTRFSTLVQGVETAALQMIAACK